MNKTRWIIFAVICIGVFAAIVITSKNGSPNTTFTGDATKIITQGPIADRVFGSTAGKVTLIEYGDFECPACGAMYPVVSAIKNAYKDNLTFIFRDFPLTTIHPNALAAATAAEAAGQQGKFYEMFDQLYQNQSTWGETDTTARDKDFDQYAQAVGLNMAKYKADTLTQNRDLFQRLVINQALFPRGIDVVLVHDDRIVAIPRTTRLVASGA